ncbi:MAG: DUF5119 domain-containing protein [Prevotellaceae bacterium]|jgi:hypothetical protein|nr:DUF5119 domain-containing protein [Prevotellaceae bacterium]
MLTQANIESKIRAPRTLLWLSLWAALSSCDSRRDILDDQGVWVRVEVDWRQAGVCPEGTSIYVFDRATGARVAQLLTNEMRDSVTLDSLKVYAGRYSLLAFNETEHSHDDISFRGTASYQTAEAYANAVRLLANNRYARGAPASGATAPLAVTVSASDVLAAAHLDDFEVDYGMIRGRARPKLQLLPKRLSVLVELIAYVQGAHNLYAGEHTGSLSSLAESVFLASEVTGSAPAAYWFTLIQATLDQASDAGTLTATFVTFGAMSTAAGLPDAAADNILSMNFQLADGSWHKVERNVTDLLRRENTPAGGRLRVEMGLGTPDDDLIVLPNVAGSKDGMFEVDVDGWGDNTNVEIPVW